MRTHRRLPLLLFLLACSLLLHAQGDWKQRDQWQHPERVMDALRLAPGSSVADIGAGEGYFSHRMARRVGREGRVYAVELGERRVRQLRALAKEHKLPQVVAIEGEPADPKLPTNALDAILVVNTYHEFRQHEAMLRAMARALKPGGLLGIIDDPMEPAADRSAYHERHAIPAAVVRADAEAHGFRFVREEEGFHRPNGENWYFLIFERVAAE